MKYRKKPVVIEAIQFDGGNFFEIIDFTDGKAGVDAGRPSKLYVKTLEGEMLIIPDDWVIKGIQGEFYPCKPDIFEATYDPVQGDKPDE